MRIRIEPKMRYIPTECSDHLVLHQSDVACIAFNPAGLNGLNSLSMSVEIIPTENNDYLILSDGRCEKQIGISILSPPRETYHFGYRSGAVFPGLERSFFAFKGDIINAQRVLILDFDKTEGMKPKDENPLKISSNIENLGIPRRRELVGRTIWCM